MPNVYMITYDLNAKGQKYKEVNDAIKNSANAYCKYWTSTYLIRSSLSPSQIVNNVKPHLDNNDSLIVIEVNKNYQGWLETEKREFIRDNIF